MVPDPMRQAPARILLLKAKTERTEQRFEESAKLALKALITCGGVAEPYSDDLEALFDQAAQLPIELDGRVREIPQLSPLDAHQVTGDLIAMTGTTIAAGCD
jgi:hypothetical protein